MASERQDDSLGDSLDDGQIDELGTNPLKDVDIDYNELEEVLKFWFPNSYYQDHWFSGSKDDEIRVKFSDLVHRIERLDLEQIIGWLDRPTMKSDESTVDSDSDSDSDFEPVPLTDSVPNVSYILAVVICLDQFSRNIYRGSDEIYQNDEKCIQIVRHFQSLYSLTPSYPINQRIFYLLPYRHQKKTASLDYVVQYIREMEDEIAQYDRNLESGDCSLTPRVVKEYRSIVNRFKKATLRNYSTVTDTIRHVLAEWKWKDSGVPIMESGSPSHLIIPGETGLIDILPVLDPICQRYQSVNLCTGLSYYSPDVDESKLYRILKEFYESHGIRHASISLSGGVDSMAISYAMHHLRIDGVLDSISAIHVDYGNKDISLREAQVVEAWCRFLRVPLITRRIEHMRRDSDIVVGVERSDYETFTKELRFNLYREAMKKYAAESIALGHHADDMSDNVVMNTARGGDILDLFTMVDHQVISGVPIDRPLLSIGKDDIYDFAHEFEVPYLADTTSESCLRGIVRKVVIPALESVDPSIRQSLTSIGRQSAMWKSVVHKMVILPIIRNFEVGSFGVSLPWRDEYSELDEIIWTTVLSEVFHNKIGTRMVKRRNLQRFCEWLQTKNGMIRLSNGYMGVFYDSNLILIRSGIASLVQKLESIEGGAPNSFVPFIIPSDLSEPQTVHFNGWKIDYESADLDEDEKTIQISDLLNGRFDMSYRLIFASSDAKIYRKMGIENPNGVHACLTYGVALDSKTKKQSANRPFFSGLDLSRYIPKLHFFQTARSDRSIRIRYTYG
jgi:tRNA(Ile)-lysidine synthetase-like protein